MAASRTVLLDGRVKAALVTALVAVVGGGWHLSHVLKDSVMAVPMVEPVRTAQIYLFENGYAENRSFITRAGSTIDRGAMQTELRFQAGERFRLDLIGTGAVRFGSTLTTERLGLFHKRIRTYSFDLARLPTHDLTAAPDGSLHFSSDRDPYIDVVLSQLPVIQEQNLNSWVLPLMAALIGSPFLIYSWYSTLRRHYLLLVAAAAFCCFVAMIAVSLPVHHGPDESLHIASGAWYSDHLLPPSMADPSVYYDGYFGVNYIVGYPDLTYLITFKTAMLLDAVFPLPLHERARLAQVGIFACLFLALLFFVSARIAMTLLVAFAVIPQAAYLLTYVNGDALSFCFGVAALAVAAAPKTAGKWPVALAFFALANLKMQYLILVPAAAFLLYRASGFQFSAWATAGGGAGLYRYAFNVFDQMRTHLTFKANQALHAGPLMRDHLQHGFWDPTPLVRTDFYVSSAKSLYAVFGAMNFAFHAGIYAAGVILAFVFLWRNGWRVNVAVLGVLVLNVAASLWYSCTYGYQAQGRYLLPAVAFAIAMSAERLQFRRVLPFALVTMFCLLRFMQTEG